MGSDDIIRLILLVVALLFSAFFSGAEAAFLSIQRGRLAHLVRTGHKGADKVAAIAGHPEKLLPTVLTGNNLANTAAAALGTTVAASYLSQSYAVIVATLGVTVLLLIFSETMPKTIAAKRAEGFAVAAVGFLQVAEAVLLPAVWILERFSRGVARMVGISDATMVTEEEIRSLIDEGREAGAVEESEAAMLEKVFHFGDLQVREVMTPRTETVWVERGTTLKEFLSIYNEHYHTRFPVYEGSMDNVVGILSVKDVVKAIATSEINEESPVTGVMRDVFFFPETKRVDHLFYELRQAGSQMAMAVDEFGEVSGLVTLKELIEVIVGRVGEEGSEIEKEYAAIDQNTFQVEGGMRIHEANQELDLDLPEGDYETIAGFMLESLGRIPQEGDRLRYQGLTMEVLEMKGRKIEKVTVIVSPI